MHAKLHLIIVSAIVLLCTALLFSGCEDPLRFAPTESQKQTAELTHELAAKVNAEGTDAGSPASQQLQQGTRATVGYMGRPKIPPNPEQFDTVTAQANQDAVERPDPWSVADNLLELGIGISALLGGVYGTKAVRHLKTAREKSQALKEIIQNNELFMNKAASAVKDSFKDQQKAQSPATKQLVTGLK